MKCLGDEEITFFLSYQRITLVEASQALSSLSSVLLLHAFFPPPCPNSGSLTSPFLFFPCFRNPPDRSPDATPGVLFFDLPRPWFSPSNPRSSSSSFPLANPLWLCFLHFLTDSMSSLRFALSLFYRACTSFAIFLASLACFLSQSSSPLTACPSSSTCAHLSSPSPHSNLMGREMAGP